MSNSLLVLFTSFILSVSNACVITREKTNNRLLIFLFLINVIPIIYFTNLLKPLLFAIEQDTWIHLGLIRRTIEAGLFPGDAFYKGFPTPPHYSLVDIFYSVLTQITGIGSGDLWQNAVFLILPGIIISTFLFARELTKNTKTAAISSIFGIYCIYKAWPFVVIPKHTSLIFYFLAHYSFFCSLRHKKWMNIITGICFGICTAIHLFTGVMTAISLVSFLAVYKIIKGKKVLPFLVFIPVGAIIASPWIINTLQQILQKPETSAAHYLMPEIAYSLTLFDTHFTILDPIFFWKIFPSILWFLAIPSLFLCLKWIKDTDVSIYLITGILVPAILLLTPLYSLMTHLFGSFMPPRLLMVMPIPILAAIMLIHIQDTLIKQSYLRSLLSTIIFMLFFTPIINDLEIKAGSKLPARTAEKTENFKLQLKVYNETISNKNVLSDPWTSFVLPHHTGAYSIGVPSESATPFVNNEKRLEDSMRFFNVNTDAEILLEILKTYEVEYVLLNLKAFAGVKEHGGDRNMPYLIAKNIESLPNIRLIDQNDNYMLFYFKGLSRNNFSF